jgi:hypothetical protein
MPLPDHIKWPSIQRLSSETVYVTEKIDGSNAQIYVGEDGFVAAGSRNRWLTHEDGTPPAPKEDNHGFGAWVHNHLDECKTLGPGTHYGEWHGIGIQRGYGLTDKRFASFEYWREDLAPPFVKVPLLYTGKWYPTLPEDMIALLLREGSKLYPGFMKPEGIVITYKNMTRAKFKKLCENDELHKSQQEAACAQP